MYCVCRVPMNPCIREEFKSMLKPPPRTIGILSKPCILTVSYFELYYCMKLNSNK